MNEQVKPEHIEKYIGRYSDATLSTVQDDHMLFEALCETIVETNPEASVEQLAEEFNKQNECKTVEEYATRRFESLVHEDTMDVISLAQRNTWIEYTKRGMIENGAEQSTNN